MKFCTKCGNELMDEAVICTKCGCSTTPLPTPNENKKNCLSSIAKVFMIISTVFLGLYLIPLAWCLPMTIIYSNKIKKGKTVSTSFKICCLLFVSTIAGIIMLCDKD